MNAQIETVIVGGGQAGLALSYHLSELGREHVILERWRIAERWRSERWDSLMFQFPNWSIKLPGYSYQTDDPDGFASKNDVIQFIDAYAALIKAPVRDNTTVRSVRQKPDSDRFLVATDDGTMEVANVVIATGPYQVPIVPALSASLPAGLFQVHSRDYRNPDQLPPGAVLVVGSGASGIQIAEELHSSRRETYLSVGRHQRTPRRYGGRDIYWWLDALGVLKQPIELQSNGRRFILHVTGVGGGHDIDLRRFAAQGMTLVGRLRGAADGKLILAADLHKNLAEAEAWYDVLKSMMDEFAQKAGWTLSAEGADPDPASQAMTNSIEELDLADAGITSIVWCSGFRYDFGIIQLPVFDDSSQPVHHRGVARCPGLYFLGLKDLYAMNSSHLSGVGDDAAFLAETIAAR